MIKTKQQALKEAKRRWGKNAIVEDIGWKLASTKAQREAALQEMLEIRALPQEEQRQHRKRLDELFSIRHAEQYRVGEITPLPGIGAAFHIRGVGDSWDEAFAEADRRENIAKAG